MKANSSDPVTRPIVTAVVAGLVLAFQWGPSAAARPPGETDPDKKRTPRCLRDLKVNRFTASPRTLHHLDRDKRVTLKWSVRVPSGCSKLKLYVGGRVGRTGEKVVVPSASTRYDLRATFPGHGVRGLDTASVTMVLPSRCERPEVGPRRAARRRQRRRGRRCGDITIDKDNQAALLRQALGTEDAAIKVKNGVDIDLSRSSSIPIAKGVRLVGGRTARQPGPRLYTKTRRRALFSISGDDVRITGLRIVGPDMGVPSGDGLDGSGVLVQSNKGVEIDNNELAGWTNSAVEVRDSGGRIDHYGEPEVRIHDNYLHHNQHVGRLGYGIAVKDNSHALIERNVFDENRHAIEGNGEDFTSYDAYDNLVLRGGGRHRWIPFPGLWIRTHQFDMHGQDHCGPQDVFSDAVYNCGRAGMRIDIRYNSFYYKQGPTLTSLRAPAVKIRGTPGQTPYGAYVVSNVFAHDNIDDAVQTTGSGLYTADNLLGIDDLDRHLRCDVDRDGKPDSFVATGQGWWYTSGGNKHFVFLKRSQERPTACP